MGWCDAAPIKLCRQRIHLDHSLADGHSIERTPVVRQFWFEHFREPRSGQLPVCRPTESGLVAGTDFWMAEDPVSR